MTDADIDSEIEALGGDLNDLNIDALVSQLARLPSKARAKVLDDATVKQLEKIAPSPPEREATSKGKGLKGSGKTKAKVEEPLRALSMAARTNEEDSAETRANVEDDEIERLSQMSEHNAQEIAELKLMFKRHEDEIRRQARDIAALLSQNTELKREVSSLASSSQPPIAVSYGSRQGHFPNETEKDTVLNSREIKASDIETSTLPSNPMADLPTSASKIKKRVIA
jgi:hypothetical protein